MTPDVSDAPPRGVDLEAVLRGEGRGLTADDAARLAIETAPGVERARAASRQASAGAERAMYGMIPQLDLSASYTRLSELENGSFSSAPIDPALIPMYTSRLADPAARELWNLTLMAQAESANFRFPVVLDRFGLRASVAYPVSDVLLQLLPAYEGARTNAEAAELRVRAQAREVALSAREAFYGYARGRAALAVARSWHQQAESRHVQVQAFVAAGSSAPVDELRLRAQLAAAHVAVVRADAGVQIGAVALRTLLHLDSGQPLAVGEDLLAELPPVEGDLDELVSQALRRRDDIRSLRRVIEAAGHQISAAEGGRYPHLVVAANLDVANPNSRVFPQTEEFRESWDVSAIVTWSPHDVVNGDRRAEEARAQQEQVRADLRQLEDAIRISVTDAATTYRATSEALAAARLGVEAGDESYRVQMERYRAGASTVSDVIDASGEQIRAQLDLVNAAIDARVAHARLRRALGEGER